MLCAAKGRTNVELREKFLLPEGASQAMASFAAKPIKSPTSSVSGTAKTGSSTASGPIVKVSHLSHTLASNTSCSSMCSIILLSVLWNIVWCLLRCCVLHLYGVVLLHVVSGTCYYYHHETSLSYFFTMSVDCFVHNSTIYKLYILVSRSMSSSQRSRKYASVPLG